MGHGRNLRRGFVKDGTPELAQDHVIGRVAELRGKGIVAVQIVSSEGTLEESLALLPPRFRGVLFLRRGTIASAMNRLDYVIFRGVCCLVSTG